MEMKSFIVKVKDFLLMIDDNNKKLDGKQYVIPKYQREYKWTEERVKTLIDDIYTRDKFLGNIMLNKISEGYEIVDGQQRVTTIILILIALFNLYGDSEETDLNEEQNNIQDYIFHNNGYILENESIGKYIKCNNNKIDVSIDSSKDIYFQKETFEYHYKRIEAILGELKNKGRLKEFEGKLLDCKFLVFLGDTRGEEMTSIEGIFLDVNFKAQLLHTADIFKGYCFKIYNTKNHQKLKELWTQIRKRIKDFEKLGYKETERTSQYLYYYLLSSRDCYEDGIRDDLSLQSAGPHYLEGKSATQTKKILEDINHYGEHIIDFIERLDSESYVFDDICVDALDYKTDKKSNKMMKKMLQEILLNKKIQYHKLPIFMVIHYLYENNNFYKAFSFKEFKAFVTNYYAYSFFFTQSGRKSKQSIDKTIFKELYKNTQKAEDARINVLNILQATKKLRKQNADGYKQFDKFDKEKAIMLYSFLDNYNAANNFLSSIYSESDYTVEHLLIHDNKGMKVSWMYGEKSVFDFKLSELCAEVEDIKKHKKCMANYLILDGCLNENIGHIDIVSKVKIITDFYRKKGKTPKHIEIILNHIQTDTYRELKKLKEDEFSESKQEEIKQVYQEFIKEYFNKKYQQKLYNTLETELKKAFQN